MHPRLFCRAKLVRPGGFEARTFCSGVARRAAGPCERRARGEVASNRGEPRALAVLITSPLGRRPQRSQPSVLREVIRVATSDRRHAVWPNSSSAEPGRVCEFMSGNRTSRACDNGSDSPSARPNRTLHAFREGAIGLNRDQGRPSREASATRATHQSDPAESARLGERSAGACPSASLHHAVGVGRVPRGSSTWICDAACSAIRLSWNS